MTSLATRAPLRGLLIAGLAVLGTMVAAVALEPCAARGRVVVTSTEVELLEEVRFVGCATLAPASLRTLDAVASTLVGNPSLRLVEVQARSVRRARVVIDHLVARGVERERLVAGTTASDVTGFVLLDSAP
ncbi:MAG: hypothetical protein M3680_24055 [Myxococcota bacterium]|nr:hypothetical protein [Myxococcota bacterium]